MGTTDPNQSFVSKEQSIQRDIRTGTPTRKEDRTPKTVIAPTPGQVNPVEANINQETSKQLSDLQRSTGGNLRLKTIQDNKGLRVEAVVTPTQQQVMEQTYKAALASNTSGRTVGNTYFEQEIVSSNLQPYRGQIVFTPQKENKEFVANPSYVPKESTERIKQLVALGPTYGVGEEIPSGAQGVFRRIERGFDQTRLGIIRSLPSESEVQKVATNLGIRNPSGEIPVGAREFALSVAEPVSQVGTYFVPVVGEAYFLSNIGASAERGNVGEALFLSSLPYVAKGVSLIDFKKLGNEVKSSYKEFKQDVKTNYDIYKFNKKYSGALSTDVKSTDIAKIQSNPSLTVVGQEIKGATFFEMRKPSRGATSGFEVEFGPKQIIPKQELGTAEYYSVDYVGTKAGFPVNVNNLPIVSGQQNVGIVEDAIKGRSTISKNLAESYFRVGKQSRLDPFVQGTQEGYATIKATFTPMKFSRETAVESTVKKEKFRPFGFLERSKPTKGFEAGEIIETGVVATKPYSIYREEKAYSDFLGSVKISEKPYKIIKFESIKIKSPTSEPVISSGERGGTQTVQILKTKLKTEPLLVSTVQVAKSEQTSGAISKGETLTSLKRKLRTENIFYEEPLKTNSVFAEYQASTSSLTSPRIEVKQNVRSSLRLVPLLKSEQKQVQMPLSNSNVATSQVFIPKVAQTPLSFQGQRFDLKFTPEFKQGYQQKVGQEFLQVQQSQFDFNKLKEEKKLKVPILKIETPSNKGGENTNKNNEFRKRLAWLAFVKKKGKYVQLGGPTTKEAALNIGAREAKYTLAASFKVTPVEATPIPIATDNTFKRYQGEFREYKIVKGQSVGTPDEFIQKRAYRLGTRAEVSQIQKAKQTKRWFTQ